MNEDDENSSDAESEDEDNAEDDIFALTPELREESRDGRKSDDQGGPD